MAIVAIIEAPGGTAEQYDAVRDTIGHELPDGCRAHVAGQTADSLLVVDVWDDADSMNAFYARDLAPAVRAAGITISEPRILPVRNMIDQGAGRTSGTIMLFDAEGMTGETYDAVVARMDAHLAAGTSHPCVSHLAADLPSGDVLVIDVWGSPEEFGRFAEEQIMPATGGALGAVEPRFVPVHNHQRAAAPVAS
jgi:hypothetical protein